MSAAFFDEGLKDRNATFMSFFTPLVNVKLGMEKYSMPVASYVSDEGMFEGGTIFGL